MIVDGLSFVPFVTFGQDYCSLDAVYGGREEDTIPSTDIG